MSSSDTGKCSFGGTDGDHLYNDVWAFDLQSRLWMQVPAVGYIPIPRTDFSASLVDGVMYIFGGRGPDGQDLGDLCAFRIKSKCNLPMTDGILTLLFGRSTMVHVPKHGSRSFSKIWLIYFFR